MSCSHPQTKRLYPITNARGFALPVVLMLLLVIAATGAILLQNSLQHLDLGLGQEGTLDTFLVAEGVIHDQLRQMAIQPEAWKEMTALDGSKPLEYATYQPAVYSTTNGIPNCSGLGCLRSMVPVGGGLLKNIGPAGGDGAVVDPTYPIYEQLDPDNPPEQDLELNGLPAWIQVEKLDRVFSAENSIGANLNTQGDGWGNAQTVRFRLTGYALRRIGSRTGRSIVVVIIELPSV